ncbi:MAG: helix-turn-helix domain-containing protein [Acidobacteriota bacterium]|nr:helix-turn-helix domain-containing protein [Acidobacteriota bacterium]
MTGGEFEESFLTVAEVADLLRLNQQTVRNWIDAGSLPALRVGRRVRIKRSDLDRILESGYRGNTPPASTIAGPNATDFWSGEPVGAVDPSSQQGETDPRTSTGADSDEADPTPAAETGESA